MNVFFFYFFFHKNLLGRLAKLNFLKKQKTSLIWHTRNPAITQNAFPFFWKHRIWVPITDHTMYSICDTLPFYFHKIYQYHQAVFQPNHLRHIYWNLMATSKIVWTAQMLFPVICCLFDCDVLKAALPNLFFSRNEQSLFKKKCYCFVYSVTSFFMPNWCFHVPDKRNNFTHSMLLWATCYFISFLLLFFLLISRTKTGECFI